ncbi:MAG: VWA domain-containing protein [bacterium]|nr:VWA domain-containing protein [bacterium]
MILAPRFLPRLAALVGLCAMLCSAQDPAPEAPVVEVAPAQALEEWYQRFKPRDAFWRGSKTELSNLLKDVQLQAQRSPDDMRAAGRVLLDLAGLRATRVPRREDFGGGSDRQRTRRSAFETLDALARGPAGTQIVSWMADEILSSKTQNSTERRRMALFFVQRQRPERGKIALLSVARDPRDPLRPDVLTTLATWPDEAVDLFLVGLIGRKFDKTQRPHPFNLLLARVRDAEHPLGQRASAALEDRLKLMLISTNWRHASRAIELARGLAPERQVPLLIDALSAWTRRERGGGGSRRILDDVVRELRRISGRSVGRNPKNWITWWIAVRQGKAKLADESTPEQQEARTQAAFFGLRPVTDKVTFVIDYSGSMANEWGTQGHSRYVEAIEQMMKFLQATGEETRFNVILFSSEPLRSSPHLVRATAGTLMRARDSMLMREPNGGTRLRPAVELALRLDRDGNVDPERLEADTVIVLCDGETEEGRGWVQPLLTRIQAEAQVKFHCVLIGSNGDGTLETLAGETGGDFIRIGG